MTRVDAGSLYGTLNLLILRTLAREDRLHGLDIQRSIRAGSDDVIQVEVGALYPALHRLEKEGLLRSEWGISESRRRARFYELTEKGRRRLAREQVQWEEHAGAVRSILGIEGRGGG